MPLSQEAAALIRANLERLQNGNRADLVVIGPHCRATRRDQRRALRSRSPADCSRVVFIGRHVYQSRAIRDGYSIEDVIDQIASAMDAAAVAFPACNNDGR